jgi:hypothetical protein
MSGYIETPKQTNASGEIINPATEDTLGLIKAKTDNLDVALSTRAAETTLGNIKAKTDQLTFIGDTLKVTSGSTTEYFFSRILTGNFHYDEQFKRDMPSSNFQNAFEYLGLALATALDTDATWAVVRVEYDAVGNEIAKRVRLNIEWAQRTIGW